MAEFGNSKLQFSKDAPQPTVAAHLPMHSHDLQQVSGSSFQNLRLPSYAFCREYPHIYNSPSTSLCNSLPALGHPQGTHGTPLFSSQNYSSLVPNDSVPLNKICSGPTSFGLVSKHSTESLRDSNIIHGRTSSDSYYFGTKQSYNIGYVSNSLGELRDNNHVQTQYGSQVIYEAAQVNFHKDQQKQHGITESTAAAVPESEIANRMSFARAESETHHQSHMDANDLSKVSGRTFYHCGLCDSKFFSNEALLEHVNTHTDSMPFQCAICNVSFIEGNQLIKHVQYSHNFKSPYACGLCSQKFEQNIDLKNHVKDHEAPKTIEKSNESRECSILQSELHIAKNASMPAPISNEEDMNNAESVETEAESCDDESGSQQAITASRLGTIVISKDNPLPKSKEPSKIVMDDVDLDSVCTILVEPSTAGGIRKKHLYKCNFCERVCKDKGSLVSHVRTHTKERPYECNKCSARFKQYAHLNDHVLTRHRQDRPFVCDRCAKAFNRKTHLQDHIRLRHTEDKLYHCTECSLAFEKRTDFTQHKRMHGKRPKYQCNMCSREFRNSTDYERHIRSHTKEKRYECEVCHLKFGLLANAKKHMIKHNKERPFKCDICPKEYHFEHDLKRHKTSHLKKKPFPCPHCHKSFKNAKLLEKHAKVAHFDVEEVDTSNMKQKRLRKPQRRKQKVE